MTKIMEMPTEFKVALDAYAAAKGRSWKRKLTEDWATGKDAQFPVHGGTLRTIRNQPEYAEIIYKAVK